MTGHVRSSCHVSCRRQSDSLTANRDAHSHRRRRRRRRRHPAHHSLHHRTCVHQCPRPPQVATTCEPPVGSHQHSAASACLDRCTSQRHACTPQHRDTSQHHSRAMAATWHALAVAPHRREHDRCAIGAPARICCLCALSKGCAGGATGHVRVWISKASCCNLISRRVHQPGLARAHDNAMRSVTTHVNLDLLYVQARSSSTASNFQSPYP